MAKYTILNNKEIELPDDLIEIYEKNIDKLDERKLSYFAYVADVENSDNLNAIKTGVIDSMLEEMTMYIEREKIIAMAKEKGYILTTNHD